jgi:hypothetical protein
MVVLPNLWTGVWNVSNSMHLTPGPLHLLCVTAEDYLVSPALSPSLLPLYFFRTLYFISTES